MQNIHMNQICANAQIFVNDIDYVDCVQGKLGNCWFISAVSVLSTLKHKHLIHKLFEQENFIQLFKHGKWIQIPLDYTLPCNENKELIYARSKSKNEFWICLLEKAYSQLFGSYEALKRGSIKDALVDLTGGIALDSIDTRNLTLKKLQYYMNTDCVMGISTNKRSKNIVPHHAYAILDIKENQIIIRNPWSTQNNGIFIMTFDQLCKYFTKLDIVRIIDSSYWKCETIFGAWITDQCGGIHNLDQNPKYKFLVEKPGFVCVSLSQYDYRYEGDEKTQNYGIGFYIFSSDGKEYFSHKKWIICRDRSWESYIDVGEYTIIPCTFDTNQCTSFTLRIFTKNT